MYASRNQKLRWGLLEATIEACRMRLRPILMTSIAFIFGVLPLAIATGTGANSRHTIDTGVMGGMFGATVLGVLFVPVFFVMVRRLLGVISTSGQGDIQPGEGNTARQD